VQHVEGPGELEVRALPLEKRTGLLSRLHPLRARGDLSSARSELHEALAVQPSRPVQLYPLAATALALGDAPAAEALARSAVEARIAVPPEFYRALESAR